MIAITYNMQDVENQEVGAEDDFNPIEWNDAEAWLNNATFAAGDFDRDDNIQDDRGYQGGFDDNYVHRHNEGAAGYGPWRYREARGHWPRSDPYQFWGRGGDDRDMGMTLADAVNSRWSAASFNQHRRPNMLPQPGQAQNYVKEALP